MTQTLPENVAFGDLKGLRLKSPELMSRFTGKRISDADHLQQSIVDILTTPLGSRVMLRNYGSTLFQLIDRPINKNLTWAMQATVIAALTKWEPRLLISKVQIDPSDWQNGKVQLALEGHYLVTGQPIRVKDITLDMFTSSPLQLTDPGVPRIIESTRTLGDIATDAPNDIVFGFVSDCGVVNSTQTKVRDAFRAWQVNFIITGGNMNPPYGAASTQAVNHAAFNEWYLSQSWYPAAGGEEMLPMDGAGRGSPHVAKFSYLPGNRRFYSKLFPALSLELFFVSAEINEPDGVTGGSLQSLWLRDSLNASTAKYRFIVSHRAPVSKAANAVAENRVAPYLSWLYQMPKAQLILHGGSGTCQHNVLVENSVPKMHLLDISGDSNGLANIGDTLQGATDNIQNVWNYASAGTHGSATVCRIAVNKHVASLTVHRADTLEILHSFNITPF